MRRTPLLIAAVSLAAVAAPAALAHSGDHDPGAKGEHPGAHQHHRALQVTGCVTADATETGVALDVLRANRPMRRVLDGATSFTATLGADTAIRLHGRARQEDGRGERRGRAGTWDDLDAGDVVTVRYRVVRGTALADLGPAKVVVDHGPRPAWCPVPEPATPTTPTAPAAPTA